MTRSTLGPATTVDVLLGVGYDPDVRLRRETQALAAAGCSIRILAWDRDGTRRALEDDGPVRVQRVAVRSRWGRGWTQLVALPRVFVRYLSAVRRRRPDVLHAVDLPMLVMAVLIAPLAGRPRIVYDAFEIYRVMMAGRLPAPMLSLIGLLERRLPRRAALVITPGEARRLYFHRLGIDSISVPNWVDPPATRTDRKGARARLAIPQDPFCVVYAGALNRARDVDALLRHAGRTPDHLVVVAGTGPDEARLREAAHDQPNVRFVGWLSEPSDLLAAADAVFYALRRDHPYAELAAPNNLYVAIAHGVPLAYREQGELAEVGRHHEIGAPFDDDPSLDAALEHLAQPDVNARIRSSLGALANDYRWAAAAERLVGAYPMKGSAASSATPSGA
jgi:glycosyltransferase involved in cell wall biosynthesis